MRAFRCRDCGEPREVDTKVGPLPTVCAVCDPESEERRRLAREGATRRGSELARLRARVRELEAQLRVDAETQGARTEPPDRQSVIAAVRRLGWAEGRRETIRRLLELSAECRAWAALLGAAEVTDLPGAA